MKTTYAREAFLALTLVTSAMGAAALAADPMTASDPDRQARARLRIEACRPDAQRLCSDIESGSGRKMACLRMHIAELTPACRDTLPVPRTRRTVPPTSDGVAK